MLESTEIVRERERELVFKPRAKENLVFFCCTKIISKNSKFKRWIMQPKA